MPITDLASGKNDRSLAIVASRPSLVIKKLFSTLGSVATVVFVLMVITSVALLFVEVVSVLFGAKLTRSITRAVADLYEGTRRVQSGDFSHRIPVRKTKDQLSELVGSFNSMTARMQELIVEAKEKERLENELKIAHDVQSQLFPKEFPRLKTLELWGGCEPARTVSGDYYDFVALGSEHAALAIGDISGKGISAALLMAHIQSALRSQLMHQNGSGKEANTVTPSAILSIVNNHLYTSSPPEKYATFFLGLYDDAPGQLIYTNAGHLAPMVLRRGQVLRLPGEGFPIGLFPGVQYDHQTFSLESGDLLVAFTDGVTETPNISGEEFGDQRLMELLMRYREQPLEQIAKEISTSVAVWAGNQERHDDTTVLLARRL
jgi:sigma-B regulation protein RsbU (phosphoserine phosphatase)